MKPCGLWLRSLAAIIDTSLVMIVWYFIINIWGKYNSAGDKELLGYPAILVMLGTVAFWIVPEWLGGATFGKWSCDLRVVNISGKKISFVQSLKRNLLRPVDFFPWYLPGFVCAKLTPNKQRLGDLWAKTMVVRRSETKKQTQVPMSVASASSAFESTSSL
jgi:uncharacterized RDD family membrane protein YckC